MHFRVLLALKSKINPTILPTLGLAGAFVYDDGWRALGGEHPYDPFVVR